MKTKDIYLIQSLLADQHNKRMGSKHPDLPLVLPKQADPPEPFGQPDSKNTESVQRVFDKQQDTEEYNKEKE